MNLDFLHNAFEKLPLVTRLRMLYRYFSEDEVLVTSSFGITSAFLLHLIHRVRPNQPIHFIDTTYHFPETLAYRRQLARHLNLRVIDLRPDEAANAVTRTERTWQHQPDLCCTVNKVTPLAALLPHYRVWVSGVMGSQNSRRAQLPMFEPQDSLLKYYPLLDQNTAAARRYLSYFRLPPHPLDRQGYGSVGCTHCTGPGGGRTGRWAGRAKTECGLHAPTR